MTIRVVFLDRVEERMGSSLDKVLERVRERRAREITLSCTKADGTGR